MFGRGWRNVTQRIGYTIQKRFSHKQVDQWFERKAGKKMGIFTEIFFYRSHQLMIGVAIGGFAATCAGIAYYGRVEEEKRILLEQKLQSLKSKVKFDENELTGEQTFFGIPFPLLTAGGWFLTVVLTSGFAWHRARLRLQYRLMDRVVNVSLNTVQNGKFMIRTLDELSLDSIYISNPAAINQLISCGARTTPDEPFVELPQDDAWFYMNAITNAISPICARDYIFADMDQPTISKWYRFALTFEKDSIKGRKFRVILVSEELLEKIATMNKPILESVGHTGRWNLLVEMSKKYRKPELLFVGPQILQRIQLTIAVNQHGSNTLP